MRRLRRHRRNGHGPGGAGPLQDAARGRDRSLEYAGLRARTGRVARAGRRLWPARRRAVSQAERGAPADHPRGRPRKELRRPARVLRLAGTAQVQDAHPRVPRAMAKLPAVPDLRRQTVARRGPGDAGGRSQSGGDLQPENRRRGGFLPFAGPGGHRTGGGPDDVGTSRSALGVPGRRGARLLAPGSHHPDAQRRRGAACRHDLDAGLQSGQHAVRAGRAVGGPAPARRRPAHGCDCPPEGPRQHGRRHGTRGDRVAARGPDCRIRSGGGRMRRRSRLSGNAAGAVGAGRQSHRRVPGRSARRHRTGTPALHESGLDSPAGGARQQPEEPECRFSFGGALSGDGRQRRGQEHPRAGDPVRRPVPPQTQGVAEPLPL